MSLNYLISERSYIIGDGIRAHVKRLKYNAVTTPYRCLVHSVSTKPSGHFLRMIGPRKPNTSSGNDEERA